MWTAWPVRWLVDLGLWAVLAAAVLLSGDSVPHDRLAAPLYQGIAVAVVGLAVLVSRRLPLVAAAVPALFVIAVSGQFYSGQLLLSQVVLAYLLGRRTDRSRAALQLLGLVGAIGIAYAIASWGTSADGWFTVATSVMAQIVLPWSAGQYTRHYAELREAGWELAERLEHEQSLVVSQVRLRERARIAADMHDSLGHELSLLAIRAGALQVAPSIDEQRSEQAAELRKAAEAATERLHQIIGVLREDDSGPPLLPAGATVAALVQRAVDSGMDVTLTDRTTAVELSEPVTRAAQRVVQEALTNAARHAPGAAVSVTLGVEGHELAIDVTNTGPTQAPARTPQGGYGLVGLDERVRLAGGTLDAGPHGAGFRVTARLPLTTSVVLPAAAQAAGQALAAARRRLRRGLVGTFWPPIAMVVVLLLLYLMDIRAR